MTAAESATASARSGPLAGLRVLDFGRYIAAPLCAALLADLSAEVIRIESATGAPDREVMPLGVAGLGAVFLQCNRGKKSMTLDFEAEAGREILRALLRSSDVVVVNLPPRALTKLGLDYESLRAINPAIILTTITAYGYEGPERDSTGFDGTGQAMSGAMYLTGTGETPFRSAVSYVDYATGIAAAYATLGALLTKFRTGRGQHVQTSLLGTALAMTNPMLIEEASGARSRAPTGNRSPIAGPSDLFATRDGWILVQVIGNSMFARWAKAIGRPEFVGDPRFADDIRRGENGAILSAAMAEWCAPRTAEQCLAGLAEVRVPACRLLNPAEALQAPATAGGGFFRWVTPPSLGIELPVVAPLARLSAHPVTSIRNAPALGQDTDSILSALGYHAEDISEFRRQGLV